MTTPTPSTPVTESGLTSAAPVRWQTPLESTPGTAPSTRIWPAGPGTGRGCSVGGTTSGLLASVTVTGGAQGPVVVAIPWTDVDDVVRMANDTAYGLGAYVWSHDIDHAITTAHRLEAGWVQINQGGGQVVGQSYGGYKQSGIGREVSLEGMIAGFTQTKQINVRLGHGATPAPKTGP